ncbi:hypothetical protein NBRC10512_002847 [Rhodotorula toruloides]|uniref:RHTO0S08e02168g1_1 n=2 Tax=Rhodotorula toruloides TaxID=5286 RepID=A0A061B1Z3_RHOTO|nr:uncharacterized protein RHTO_03527 [Rhodotorula toruloides NP11]EMS20291.1 hypothetical protein RHTO_03527 [Rhodotorula toruloides NP11]CDR43467.1 RHTO0S08e02168g1_1 [Rhodotorula toruloides]
MRSSGDTTPRPPARTAQPAQPARRTTQRTPTSHSHSPASPGSPSSSTSSLPSRTSSTSSPFTRSSPVVGGSLPRRHQRPPRPGPVQQLHVVDWSREGNFPEDRDEKGMARSVGSGDGPDSPDAEGGSGGVGGFAKPAATLPDITLTTDELVAAPHEVLVSLVERHQEDLARLKDRVEKLEEEGRERDKEKRALERDLESTKGRMDELLTDQARMEEELAGRIEVLEKLRGTVRDLEREKREATKRYREQADSFDSERQSWYDQEQHYKTRIAGLASSSKKSRRKSPPSSGRKATSGSEVEGDEADQSENDGPPRTPRDRLDLPARSSSASPSPSTTSARSLDLSTPATSEGPSTPGGATSTELALRAQLDTLSTAHTSLSHTLRALQTEMADLKRVYQDLQEENESYEILLGERTLSGEVSRTELFRKSFQWGESGIDGEEGVAAYSGAFGFAGGLEAVGEEAEDAELGLSSDDEEDDEDATDATGKDSDEVEKVLLESKGTGEADSVAVATDSGRKRRKSRRSMQGSVSGAGGLDLAAELEAAQKVDEMDEVDLARQKQREERRKKRAEEKEQKRKAAQEARRASLGGGTNQELHDEIRRLHEENKALALYVSKIVDRVCSQEGFEKVLAVDFRNTPKVGGASPGPPQAEPKPRPASVGFFRSPAATPSPVATRKVEPSTPMSASSYTTAPSATPSSANGTSLSTPSGPRKSGGFGWDSVSSVFSSFSRSTSATPSPSAAAPMKPLVLAESARKLEVGEEYEDEEDRKERARIRQEMVQLGFDPPPPSRLSRPPTTPSPNAHSPGDGGLRSAERAKALEALARNELKEGRSSGFTEPPQRRMSLLAQRRNSSRASIGGASDLGLGIQGGLGIGADGVEGRSGSSSGPPTPSQENPEEEAPGYRKALRRLSKTFSSPPLG